MPSNRQQVKSAQEKDAYNNAEAPSFALGFDKKLHVRRSIKEFEHEVEKVAYPASGGEAYNLVVKIPEEIEDMASIDVEV